MIRENGIRRQGGFTLIEMLVVVAVISVLAAIGIPRLSAYLKTAETVEAWEFFAHAKKDVSEYYQEVGRLPKDNEAAGLPPPEGLQGRYVGGMRVDDGVITILMRQTDAAGRPLALSMLPAVVTGYPTGALLWFCLVPEQFPNGGTGEPVPQDVTLLGTDRTWWGSEELFPFHQCHTPAFHRSAR